MTNGLHNTKIILTGATGFIARWTLVELTARNQSVLALMRKASQRHDELARWIDTHGGRAELLETAELDLDAEDLGLDDETRGRFATAEVVYHLAARFGLGLSIDAARRANVHASTKLIEICAGNAALRRFIHISGYRTMGRSHAGLDIDDEVALHRHYREHGAYEVSKMEAHERVRRIAEERGVPLTRIGPAMVIGDSRTGETTQMTGLAEALERLWYGRLPALPGNEETFLPVVSVDYLARLLAEIPSDEPSLGEHIVAFDDRTPTLPKLIALAADRMDVRQPRVHLPASFLRRLPQALSGTHREALSFVSRDRYDPTKLSALNRRLGLRLPDVSASLERWIDFLLDTRFGRRPPSGGRSVAIAGQRTFLRGSTVDPEAIFLHGVLLNLSSWDPVLERLDFAHLAADLPGLGRSHAGGGDPCEWMSSLLANAETKPWIVGHSLGSAFAVQYAAAHPERVAGLILVSPFFLQGRPSWLARQPWLLARLLRSASSERLARQLAGELDAPREDAIALLRRRNVARSNARWLHWASRHDIRAHLRRTLATLELPITLIVGANDPLLDAPPIGAEQLVVVPDAGHYPQLTHPELVAHAIDRALRQGNHRQDNHRQDNHRQGEERDAAPRPQHGRQTQSAAAVSVRP